MKMRIKSKYHLEEGLGAKLEHSVSPSLALSCTKSTVFNTKFRVPRYFSWSMFLFYFILCARNALFFLVVYLFVSSMPFF